MVSEVKLEMEMTLDAGSTEGKSKEDVENEIAETFKPILEKANPFYEDPGTSLLEVGLQFIDVCTSVDDIGNEEAVGEDCDPEAGKRRKRRNFAGVFVGQGSMDFFKYVTKPIVKIAITYKGSGGPIPVSPKSQKSLAERIEQTIKDLGNHAKHLSDEQLCGYSGTSLNTGVSYISKAISSSANLMKMKGVQTVKAPLARKFYLFNWMDALPDKIKKLPLTMLAIPGTHQSATSALQRELVSKRTYPWHGEETIPVFFEQTRREYTSYQEVQEFYAADEHLGQYNDWDPRDPTNEFKYLEAWSTCQRSSISDQLTMGIRYFDFR